MENITITLIPGNASFQGKKALILTQPYSLGRQVEGQDNSAPNQIRFNSKVVSRQHAKISYTDGKVLFRAEFIFITKDSFLFKILKAQAALS